MIVPAVAGAARAAVPAIVQGARVAAPAAARRLTEVLERVLARPSKEVIDVVEKSTGIKGALNKAVRAVKENPVTASIVAYELFQLGESALDAVAKTELKRAVADLIEANPDVKQLAQSYGWEADPTEVSDVAALLKQSDEMRVISEAAALMRGKENLITLRRALQLTDAHYVLHDAHLAMRPNVY